MAPRQRARRAWLSWAVVGLLAVLCGFLGFLQIRWINEVSRADKERLQQQLQTELNHLSREFNNEITAATSALLPTTAQIEDSGREKAYAAQYVQWKESHDRVFTRIALVTRQDESLQFSMLNLDSVQFAPADWPSGWEGIRERMTARLAGGGPAPITAQDSAVIDLPRFGSDGPGPPGRFGPGPMFGFGYGPGPRGEPGRGHGPGRPPPGREQEWLLAELSLDYARSVLLPELLQRHLGGHGKLDYRAEVVSAADPSRVIFQSTAGPSGRIADASDASVMLFDVNYSGIRRSGDPNGKRSPPPIPQDGTRGRWRLLVRHQAGSLEAVVSRARWQSVGLSAGILLLILATGAALVRFSRRAQQLAELKMNFVAGVSHELRTPLTVIRTAAYNLRGKLATRPEQVERYGELIQSESEKLQGLVEQVLRFTSAEAGHVIRSREPVSMETLIDDGLRSSRASSAGGDLVIEKHVAADLPLVLADELALKHAIQNLVENALKYGTEGGNWIGVFANAVDDAKGPAVEVRVADRGPGIPADEQDHIFDPFFRGRHAVQDQIHGTGLGLNLVKKIVEAHGGSIRLKSEPMKGTEFIVRIPAAPPELQNEFAHSTH